MTYVHHLAGHAWLGGSDLEPNIEVATSDQLIKEVSRPSTARTGADSRALIPGLVNAHSHAFHRALRGRTHEVGGDFWIWRELMYELAATLTPETYEELATAVYQEMARSGITTVGEFHYLHHQPDGTPYNDSNEMGHALIRAARTAGIRIALLDAGYLRGGLDGGPLAGPQVRFGDGSVENWLERFSSLRDAYDGQDDVVIGLAPHSVRALTAADLEEFGQTRPAGVPVHIHLSEQPAENAECLAVYGATPTQLLAERGVLGPGTTAVHATHLTAEDIALLGESGTGICYCPTTERDLADGLGPVHELHSAGCRISVGSDSHAVIDLFEEGRGIELHTRLMTGRRGTFGPEMILESITAAGSAALGFDHRGIVEGQPGDLAVIDLNSDRIRSGVDSPSLGQIVFAATNADVGETYVAGRRVA